MMASSIWHLAGLRPLPFQSLAGLAFLKDADFHNFRAGGMPAFLTSEQTSIK